MLDHAARARAEGHTGVKTLLLYPMNALANDQAKCHHDDALLDTHRQHFHDWNGGLEPTRRG